MARLIPTGPPKFCPACGFNRPRSDFYGVRHANGQIYALALCVKHNKQRVIAGQQAHPEHAAAVKQRSRERRRQDLEWVATNRVYQREHARKRRGITPDRFRASPSTTPIVSGSSPTYDAAPFIAWLLTLGETPADIAAVCGIARPQVYDYLRGRNTTVTLDVVDRACMRAGADLNDLYPLDNAA